MWFLLILIQESICALDDPLREWDPGTKETPKNRGDQQEISRVMDSITFGPAHEECYNCMDGKTVAFPALFMECL
jgi:hypothetical protein